MELEKKPFSQLSPITQEFILTVAEPVLEQASKESKSQVSLSLEGVTTSDTIIAEILTRLILQGYDVEYNSITNTLEVKWNTPENMS